MFSCNNVLTESIGIFRSCRQGPARVKKIGKYIYHYDYLIGNGTYSQVYEGVGIQKDTPVAIKVVDLGMIKQKNLSNLLFQETELLSQLNHPNVIKCHALLKSQNRVYIVTELCKKDNLETMINKVKNKKLPRSEIERIIYDIFLGLQYLSQKSIIHRDLKTANILFSQNGKAKIADFGFATHGFTEFKDNVFVGTPLYMSPEAILQQKYGPKTDIWSFGVILYQLYHGFTPLSSCKTEKDLLTRIVKPISITMNQSMPSEVAELIQGCLEPNSHYRWGIQKIAGSDYIQSLKRKFYIESNLFQSLNMRSSAQQSTAFTSKYHHSPYGKEDLIVSKISNTWSTQEKKQDKGKFNHYDGRQLHFQKQIQTQKIILSSKESKDRDITKNSKTMTSIKIKSFQPHSYQKKPYEEQKIIRTSPDLMVQRQRESFGPSIESQLIKKLNSQNRIPLQFPPNPLKSPKCRNQRQPSLNDQISNTNTNSNATLKKNGSQTPISTLKKTYSYEKKKHQLTFDNAEIGDLERKSQLPILNNFGMLKNANSIFTNKKITYKQATSLVHHCRLLHKVLQFPRYKNNYLQRWLMFLLNDLKQNGTIYTISQSHAISLRSVLQKYCEQYHQNITYDARDKQLIPQFKYVIRIMKNLLEIDQKNKDKSNQKQLLNYLFSDTKNLEICLGSSDPDLQKYSKQSKCQVYLDCFNNNNTIYQLKDPHCKNRDLPQRK